VNDKGASTEYLFGGVIDRLQPSWQASVTGNMQVSTDLQLLVLPPMILEARPSQFTTRQQQLTLFAQFEESAKTIFLRLEYPGKVAPRPCRPSKKLRRHYLPRPDKAMTLNQFKDAFASCVHLHNIEPGDIIKGFHVYALVGIPFPFVMPMPNPEQRAAMQHAPLDVAMFIHQAPILLEPQPQSVKKFETYMGLFEKSFPDMFMRVIYPEHATHVTLAYMLRPELLHRAVAATPELTPHDILVLFVRCLKACHLGFQHVKLSCLGQEEISDADLSAGTARRRDARGRPNDCPQS